ncbi:hypothetical protein AADY36_09810 [Pseudoalteromonas sp. D15MCD-2]|uniref:hypothetical protein n=1 Tax=Pseudoalteromonas TaxID=53246 RepID=UPI001EFC94A1|nr:hypothetical protein [Pseudoalteromonas shioyasakiensis]MCG9735612.1 hypothetical protein [Pseudoalteromonas shioyasakiensis]
MSNSASETSPKLLLLALIALAFACVGGVYYLWFKGVGVGFGGTTETWAHFGSFFGGTLGPALSFFSFLGVIYTVYLQSKSNKEQALANEQAAMAIKSSEQLAKDNLKEQKKLHLNQIEHDKQQQILGFLNGLFNDLDQAGVGAISDFVPRESGVLPKIGPYFNAYFWKLKKTAPTIKRLRDELNKESAELIILLIDITIGQLSNFQNQIRIDGHIFTNQDDIGDTLMYLAEAEGAFHKNKKYLEAKFGILDNGN